MDGHVLGSESEQPRAAVMYSRPVQQLLAPQRLWPAKTGSD